MQLHKLHSLWRSFLHFQKRFCYQYYCEPKATCGMNEHYFNMVRESLWRNRQKSQIIGCLSNNHGDVSKKGKKAIGTIDWQNNKIGRDVHHPFCYFFAVIAELPHKNSLFHILWRTWTQDKTFFFFSWTLTQSFGIQLQKKIVNIWQIEQDGMNTLKLTEAALIFRSCLCCCSLSFLISLPKPRFQRR